LKVEVERKMLVLRMVIPKPTPCWLWRDQTFKLL